MRAASLESLNYQNKLEQLRFFMLFIILFAVFTTSVAASENSHKVHCAVSSRFKDGATGNEVLEFGSFQESDWFGFPRGKAIKLRGTVTFKSGNEAEGNYIEKRLITYGGAQWRKFFPAMCEHALINEDVVFVPEDKITRFMVSLNKGESFITQEVPSQGAPFLVDKSFNRVSREFFITQSVVVDNGSVVVTQVSFTQPEIERIDTEAVNDSRIYLMFELFEQGKLPVIYDPKPIFKRVLKSGDWGKTWHLVSYEYDETQLSKELQILDAGQYSYNEKTKKVEADGLIPSVIVDLKKLGRHKMARSEKQEYRLPDDFTDPFAASMIKIPAGTFIMGSNDVDVITLDQKPAHEVTLKAFYMSKYEVTQGQWRMLIGSNPSEFNACGDDCPVDFVSWNDVQAFIKKLNQATGEDYRLPTEAEWEYACRGGIDTEYCGSDDIESVGWVISNSGRRTHSVGTRKPNDFGLFDMTGNVYEWVQDWYGEYNTASATNPQGPSLGKGRYSGDKPMRILRGCDFELSGYGCRYSYRHSIHPQKRSSKYGFRLAKSISESKARHKP